MKTIVLTLFFIAVIISSASAAFMNIAQLPAKAENIYLARAPQAETPSPATPIAQPIAQPSPNVETPKAVMYHCTDSRGNSIITDTPPADMKTCVLMDSVASSAKAEIPYPEKAPKAALVKRAYALSVSEKQEQDEDGEYNEDSDYCAKSRRQCYNTNPDRRFCEAQYEECLGTPAPPAQVDSE